jgi:hypothetical protein|tara:strand:- start:15 stop:602 length:588 start_codon:yes stop_codon:yes gene_type:complete
MAQTSTSILSSKSHKADITVTEGASFTVSSDVYSITTTSTSLSNLAQFDVISVTGTTNNNKSFTVKSVADDGLSIVVYETVTAETSDGSTDTVIDHVGFVSDKQKGDGYYSQPDGVHTVAYKIDTSVVAATTIKMQGSLATTPTEDDWFDIADSGPTPDLSTTIFSFNFTGNFVWVRAKITGMTAGTITEILLNN